MRHGGDIYRNKIKYDFSININPFRYPLSDDDKESMFEASFVYPDIECEELRKNLSMRYSVKEDYILCGNGASELFLAVVNAIKPKTALMIAPTFSGYEYVCKDSNIKRYYLDEQSDFAIDDNILSALTDDIDILFVGYPENPTGNIIEEQLLYKILDIANEKNITVVLDDCFYELSFGKVRNNYEKMLTKYKNLIVVNAFTKSYGMPGIRLGYLMSCNKDYISLIHDNLSEWNVSGMAQVLGNIVAKDSHHIKESAVRLADERRYLSDKLRKLNLKCFVSNASFVLIKTDIDLYQILLDKGFLIKDCKDIEGLKVGYYRIAVKNHQENEILIETIKDVMEEYD